MQIISITALITGGASGLGEECARILVKEGANVAILDLDEDRGKKLVSELGKASVFCKTDVTDANSVEAATNKAVESFGTIHVVVNCAGISDPCKILGKEGPMDIGGFKRVLEVNLIGSMNVIRLAAAKMVANQGNEDGEKGVVINTASAAAFDGQIGQAAYSASKAGIVGMTLPIAREFAAYGIRVVSIAPGLFETPMLAGLPEKAKASLCKMTPFPNRLGKPIEFASLVRHIIENPMLNGEVIRLDGALRMAAK